jgi:serine/threonine-protein kinase HipA
MTFQNRKLVHVYFMWKKQKIPMGRLVLNNRQLFFEYLPEFIKTELQLSPFKLPLKPGVFACEDRLFEGLFGVFNDSLPDGWGRLLLDRKLKKIGINPGNLTQLDRLCFVGNRGMGALIYEPATNDEAASNYARLDKLAEEALEFQECDDDRFVDNLLNLNGSSAGARPKILIKINQEDWIIKFPSLIDPKDIGSIEYAYHLMANEAQLDVPSAKLFPSHRNPGYFGVKRFDRVDESCVHMHTISGLLHADHRLPSLDYATIIKATLWLTKNSKECEKQFRAAAFNVLSHNRDDHAKNFSFLMDDKGAWRVSPAYDLTFSSGPAGEHCSMIMNEGKNPTLSHLMKLAEIAGVKQQRALLIIDEVRSAVSRWKDFAKTTGVSSTSLKMIQTTLNRLAKNIFS